jgi:hypothetical protein
VDVTGSNCDISNNGVGSIANRVRTSTKTKTKHAEIQRKQKHKLVGIFSQRNKSSIKPKFTQQEMLAEALETEVAGVI